ncbi:MAG: MliC family protein [Synergistaceae bacterium]|jgi:membrane-bound inhibitor of C-type lysozyme|nr:MliC family protein [Synergistaceae bacterium]
MTKTFKSWRLAALSSMILVLLASAAFTGVNPDDGRLTVTLDGVTHVLNRVESSSIQEYVNPDNRSTCFLSYGHTAILIIDGKRYDQFVLIRDSSGHDEFTLTVDGRNYLMKSAISASGAKYEAADDSTTTIWSKGTSAMLMIRGVDYDGYDTWMPDGEIWLP